MALIVWNDERFSVKVPSIDKQHKGIVILINKLHDAMLSGTAKSILKDIISELISYTKSHFIYEEEQMLKAGYPHLEKHKVEHESFIDKTTDFQEQYLRGDVLLSIDIINFLRDWLINHIAGADMNYSSLMEQQHFK